MHSVMPDDVQYVQSQIDLIEQWMLHDLERAYQASIQLSQSKLQLPEEVAVRLKITLGKVLWSVGKYPQSIRIFNQALKLAKTPLTNWYAAEIYLRRGISQLNLKQYLKASRDIAEAIKLAVDQFDVEIVIESYLYLASVYAFYQRQVEADELLKVAFEMAEMIDCNRLIAKASVFVSGHLFEKKDYQAALAVIYRSEMQILMYGNMTWIVESGKTIAECYLKLHQDEMAELYFSTMLALAKQQKMDWAAATLAVSFSEYLIRKGQDKDARAMLSWSEEKIFPFSDDGLLLRIRAIQIELFKLENNYSAALMLSKEKINLTLRLIEGDLHGLAKTKTIPLDVLNNAQEIVNKTKGQVLSVLGSVFISEVKKRTEGFYAKCDALPRGAMLIGLKVKYRLSSAPYVEKKIISLLHSLCVNGDVWSKVKLGEFLIYCEGDLEEFCYRIDKLVYEFPWEWHRCARPSIEIQPLRAEDVMKKAKLGLLEC